MGQSRTAETVLAANLAALMKATPGMESALKVKKRCGVGVATIWRILNGDGSCQLGALNNLATAFGVSPFDLLTPKLNGKSQTAGAVGLSAEALAIARAYDDLPKPDQEMIRQFTFLRLEVHAGKPKPRSKVKARAVP